MRPGERITGAELARRIAAGEPFVIAGMTAGEAIRAGELVTFTIDPPETTDMPTDPSRDGIIWRDDAGAFDGSYAAARRRDEAAQHVTEQLDRAILETLRVTPPRIGPGHFATRTTQETTDMDTYRDEPIPTKETAPEIPDGAVYTLLGRVHGRLDEIDERIAALRLRLGPALRNPSPNETARERDHLSPEASDLAQRLDEIEGTAARLADNLDDVIARIDL